MDPESTARMLLSYYQNNPSDPLIMGNTIESDNEYVMQILLSMYVECYKVYTESLKETISLEQFSKMLNMVSISMGYKLIVTSGLKSDLNTIIHYARINPDLSMVRSPYHPFHLITYMGDGDIPTSYNKLFNDSDYLRNSVNIHEYDASASNITLISFQKVNLHFAAST